MRRILLILLLLSPALAMAASQPQIQIYGYANSVVLGNVFNAIAMWMGSPDFGFLVRAIALLGFTFLAIAALFGESPKQLMMYLGVMIIGFWLLFGLPTTVVISDLVGNVSGGSTMPQVVANVPAIASYPIGLVDGIGMDISDAMDTVFSTVGSNNGNPMPTAATGTPFGGTYGIMSDLGKTRITDPVLRQDVETYLRYCMIPYLSNGWFSATDLERAPNFWQAVGSNSWQAVNQYVPITAETLQQVPNAFGSGTHPEPVVDGNGNVITTTSLMPCRDIQAGEQTGVPAQTGAWTTINNMLKQAQIGQHLFGGGGQIPGSGQWVQSANDASIATVGDWAAGQSTAGANLALNAAMIETTRGAYQQAAQALGANNLMVALNTENARRAQKSGWYTTAVLFRDMAGYFYSVLQCFVIALCPLVALLAFLPMFGMKIVGGFFKVLFWMMLWWPGLAVVNFIMQSYYLAQLSYGGAACADGVIGCVGSLGVTNDVTGNMMIAAGLMSSFVPAILWGVVSVGSFALTSVLDRASGSGYATQAGESIAHGSARFGDISMATDNLNKHNSELNIAGGVAAPTFSAATNVLDKQDGGGATASANGQLITSTVSTQASQALSQSTAAVASAKTSLSNDLSASNSWANSQLAGLQHGATKNENGGYTYGSLSQAQQALILQAMMDKNNSIAQSTDLSNSTAHDDAFSKKDAFGVRGEVGAKGGLGVGAPPSAGLSAGGALTYVGENAHATTDKTTDSKTQKDSNTVTWKDDKGNTHSLQMMENGSFQDSGGKTYGISDGATRGIEHRAQQDAKKVDDDKASLDKSIQVQQAAQATVNAQESKTVARGVVFQDGGAILDEAGHIKENANGQIGASGQALGANPDELLHDGQTNTAPVAQGRAGGAGERVQAGLAESQQDPTTQGRAALSGEVTKGVENETALAKAAYTDQRGQYISHGLQEVNQKNQAAINGLARMAEEVGLPINSSAQDIQHAQDVKQFGALYQKYGVNESADLTVLQSTIRQGSVGSTVPNDVRAADLKAISQYNDKPKGAEALESSISAVAVPNATGGTTTYEAVGRTDLGQIVYVSDRGQADSKAWVVAPDGKGGAQFLGVTQDMKSHITPMESAYSSPQTKPSGTSIGEDGGTLVGLPGQAR